MVGSNTSGPTAASTFSLWQSCLDFHPLLRERERCWGCHWDVTLVGEEWHALPWASHDGPLSGRTTQVPQCGEGHLSSASAASCKVCIPHWHCGEERRRWHPGLLWPVWEALGIPQLVLRPGAGRGLLGISLSYRRKDPCKAPYKSGQ